MKITRKQLEEICCADQIVKSKGTYKILRGFFYRHGGNEEKWRDKVVDRLNAAGIKFEVIDCYENYAAFRGGASVARNSHWAVVVDIKEQEVQYDS